MKKIYFLLPIIVLCATGLYKFVLSDSNNGFTKTVNNGFTKTKVDKIIQNDIKVGQIENLETNKTVLSDKQVKAMHEVKKAKIRQALANFNRITSEITKEDLEEEQDLLLKRKKEMEAIKVELPAVSMITDENGIKWKKLMYPNGEIRYEFPN